MSLLDWLMESAEVSRTINGWYMLMVSAISLSVLFFAWYTKDRNAVRLYILSIPIWLFIEGIGLVWGIREYSTNVGLTYFVVAVMEDPGWVTLSYIVAWRLFHRQFPHVAGGELAKEEVSPPSSS